MRGHVDEAFETLFVNHSLAPTNVIERGVASRAQEAFRFEQISIHFHIFTMDCDAEFDARYAPNVGRHRPV